MKRLYRFASLGVVGTCLFLAVLTVADARTVELTILHTCDVHGNILPTENYDGQTNLGGIARCATVIRQVRATDKNVLLLDAGDTIQGTAVSYLTGGQVMVKLLNLLRYDAWCWGNHEFDWGLEKPAACAEAAGMPILNANTELADAHLPAPDPAARIAARLRPYRLMELDGVKVGVIGLNTPGIPSWSRPRLISGLKFADSVETLKRVVPELRRAGAQVLILVCHQGYRDGGDDHANQVNAIGRSFPELDLIIGGHTHRNFPEYKVSNVLYCQADYYGIHLGRVDLGFDTEAGRVVHRESNTLLMDEHVPLDQKVLDVCREELDRAAKVTSSIIGTAGAEFDTRGAPKQETPIHDLIFESIAAGLKERGIKVDAIVHGIFEKRATLRRGPVTVGDVFRIVPYENTIGVAMLTPAQLKEILEENAAACEKREFRGIWGLRWRFDPSGSESNRVISLLRADGSPLHDEYRVAVAFNSYDLASGGRRWPKLRELADKPETELREVDLQVREAVINYIRRQGEISPTVKGWWKAERRAATVTSAR